MISLNDLCIVFLIILIVGGTIMFINKNKGE